MVRLWGYTRTFLNETGASLHLALEEDGRFTALNHAFGVLFPKADFSDNGFVGEAKGLVCPWLFRMKDGAFGVAALRRNVLRSRRAFPEQGDEGSFLLFRSEDMIRFDEVGLRTPESGEGPLEDIRVTLDGASYLVLTCRAGHWQAYRSADLVSFAPAVCPDVPARAPVPLPDAAPACAIDLTDAEADALRTRFVAPRLPADARRYPFPLMPERGDPMALRYEDGYLFMATDDEHGQRRLLIRRAKTLADIPQAEDHVIFTAPETGDYSGCLWAPELHWVGGRLCVFFAAGMPHWYTVQSRVMILEGSDPTDPACWSAPRRMERTDGSHLTHDGVSITLDMTVLDTLGGCFVVWSQRPILQDPLRCGTADLYIARLNTKEPWRLASEPLLLTRPEYGWERIHSEVCEGPFLLRHEGMLYLTYACALIDHTYAVGVLVARDGDDLLSPAAWRKENYPLVHRLSMPDQLGGGHNAFVRDENGNDILTIHALSMAGYLHDPTDGRRYPAFRQVIWDKHGFPHLDAQD